MLPVLHNLGINCSPSGVFRSSESSGFSLGLKKSKDVALSDWSLNVSHKLSSGVVEELNLDLGDTTSGAL